VRRARVCSRFCSTAALDDAVDPETLILGLEASAKGSNPGTGNF